MGVRRVVTGHTAAGKAIVASDTEVDAIPVGALGSSTTLVWGRDDVAEFPDDGSQPERHTVFPPPGGCGIAVLEIAPHSDEFDEFVKTQLAPWADPDAPGMHRTATLDYDVVLEGTVGLEVDDGVVVTLHEGDIVVQNGTTHRWLNQGDTIARILAVTIGAESSLPSGPPT
jgi:mannose-6-phosphate isomerase-like protein (cupin superfamily)